MSFFNFLKLINKNKKTQQGSQLIDILFLLYWQFLLVDFNGIIDMGFNEFLNKDLKSNQPFYYSK